MAVIHSQEILFYDLNRNEWKEIPVWNTSNVMVGVMGNWAPDGHAFYYYQPSLLGCLLGGDLVRVRWP